MIERAHGFLALTLTVLMSAAVGFAQQQPKLNDQEIAKLLVGKWLAEEDGDKGAKGTTYFKADGTFKGEATITFGEKSVEFGVSGTWKVEDGFLIESFKQTSGPKLIKEQTTKDQVLALDDKTFKFKTEIGETKVHRRIKE